MSEMLRIAMLIQAYYPRLGGAERQLASLAPLLKHLGVEIQIFTRRYDKALLSYEMINEVPVHRLTVPNPKPLAAVSYSLAAMPMIAKFKPHVIHAHELLSPATTAVVARRLFGIPVVAKVLRGGELGDLAKLKRRAFGARRIESLKRRIDSFIVISREIDRELMEIGVPPEKRVFIPNGVDLERFSPLSTDGKASLRHVLNLPSGLIAVFSGRLDPEKRLHHLLEAWNQILIKQKDATLLILGTGTEEVKLKQTAGANVRFEGVVEDVAPYLRAADVFVLPSATEGLSNALLEAMASGLAPVATSVGGASDLIENNRNGILVPPNDPQALMSALLTLLDDDDLRAQFGTKSREIVTCNYSLSVVAEKLSLLYQKFIPGIRAESSL